MSRGSEAGLRHDVKRFRIAGTSHISMADFDLWFSGPARSRLSNTGHSKQRQIDIINALIGGFFDRHLRGMDNGFPEEQSEGFEEIIEYDYSWLREWWNNRS